jgi:hypothetical protein
MNRISPSQRTRNLLSLQYRDDETALSRWDVVSVFSPLGAPWTRSYTSTVTTVLPFRTKTWTCRQGRLSAAGDFLSSPSYLPRLPVLLFTAHSVYMLVSLFSRSDVERLRDSDQPKLPDPLRPNATIRDATDYIAWPGNSDLPSPPKRHRRPSPAVRGQCAIFGRQFERLCGLDGTIMINLVLARNREAAVSSHYCSVNCEGTDTEIIQYLRVLYIWLRRLVLPPHF